MVFRMQWGHLPQLPLGEKGDPLYGGVAMNSALSPNNVLGRGSQTALYGGVAQGRCRGLPSFPWLVPIFGRHCTIFRLGYPLSDSKNDFTMQHTANLEKCGHFLSFPNRMVCFAVPRGGTGYCGVC
jgi:hypothetical protein